MEFMHLPSGILRQIFNSRSGLEFSNDIFLVKSLRNMFAHNFSSMEGIASMATKF